MIPRFTNGVDRRGYASVICLNSSSASVLLPLRMKLTARLKSAVAFGDGGPAGPNDADPPHDAGAGLPPGPGVHAPPAACAGFPGAAPTGAAPPAAGSGAAVVESGFGDHGIEAQPLNNATSATSIECRRHILRNFRLAIARRLQLSQHLEALLYPLVIHTILRARSVDLVRLDGLFFEWEHLLF